MNLDRCLSDLQAEDAVRKMVATALNDYAVAGKFLEQFEEDFDCTILFDEIHYERFSSVEGIYFNHDSSKTAFLLKYNV